MDVLEEIAGRFPAGIRERGRRIMEGEAVRLVEFADRFVEATVEDGPSKHRVDMARSPRSGQVEFRCDCSDVPGAPGCEHVWALALRAQVVAGAGGFTLRGEGDPEPEVTPVGTPDWQRRLLLAQGDGDEAVADPWAAATRVETRYEYVIDLARALERGELPIEVHKANLKKDGTWGTGRHITLSPHTIEQMPSGEDRALLQHLWSMEGDGGFGSVRALRVPVLRSRAILTDLVATGRCRLRFEGDVIGPPLTRDDGPPWRFALQWTDRNGEGVLDGVLERPEVSRPLHQASLCLQCGLVIIDGTLADLEVGGAMHLLLDLRSEGVIVVPPEDREAFKNSLALLPDLPVRNLDRLDEAPIEPKPCLFIESPDSSERLGERDLRCRVEFDYDGLRIEARDPSWVVTDPSGDRAFRRHTVAERKAVQALMAEGARPVAGWRGQEHDALLAVNAFQTTVSSLVAKGWVVEASGAKVRSAGDWNVSVQTGIDWFDVEGGLTFEGEVASIPALLAAARAGKGVVRLGDGSMGLLPEKWLDDWGLLKDLGETEGDAIRVRKNRAWVLDALLAARSDVSVDAQFRAYREKIRAFKGIDPVRERDDFQGELRPYQREGLGWFGFLSDLGFGGCLADDMGLGKTVQVLAHLDNLHDPDAEDARPSLVVAPRSVVFNWIKEARRFAPRLRVLEYTGPKRHALQRQFGDVDLVVTTYGTVRNDILDLRNHRFGYAILDESQAIKNARSQTAKAVRLLTCDHRLALSGTPIENHLGELWSLFEFLNPGMLGRSSAFKELVGKGGTAVSEEARRALAAGLRPFILRRTKEQVLTDLPRKTEQVIECELSAEHQREYDDLAAHYRSALLGKVNEGGIGRMKIQILEALLRLRQAACHPGLVDQTRTTETSAKLDELIPRLEEIAEAGHKALVFSQFTKFLGVVRQRLDGIGMTYEYLDGRTRKREEKVERFQEDPDCPIFLVSLKAGGVGLNLTAASYVFLLDPWWNPAAENQAVDRAHRIGQTKPVMTYRLITRGTVEEKVRELQSAKLALADAVLGEDNAVLRDLTSEDLGLLLS